MKSKIPSSRARTFLDHIDLLSELLTPPRRPQDAGAPECSRTELRVLAALARKAPIATTTLALLLEVPASTLTRAIDQLVKKGFAERQRNKEDRRVIEVAFSPTGAELNRFALRARLRQAQAALNQLDEKERESLATLLAKLVK